MTKIRLLGCIPRQTDFSYKVIVAFMGFRVICGLS